MTSKWAHLPDALPRAVRRLVHELREMKDRSGLSLHALAQRTTFSKSSWERYLNGKVLPPRQAVLALGDLTGAEPKRLTAMWEDAKTAWNDSCRATARATGTDTAPTLSAVHRRGSPIARLARALLTHLRSPKWAAITAATLLACAIVGVWTARDQTSGEPAPAEAGTTATAPAHRLETTCFGDSCTRKDPKQTGCAGDAWTAALTRFHGVYVELRYSDACKAAWGRISWGRPGDIAEVVTGHGETIREKVHYDTDVYTAMTEAMTPAAARACTTLTTGHHTCTPPGGTKHLTEPPNPPMPPSPSGE
ncbi:helix-turn-helix domain-containing protein [Streptomyces hygroscopicus]|uniref:helix-turn-helix domain-containing protein n=1 Tax=Streptomyces hygroscopicus TaxID=1912 RepID=UPI00131DB9C6|nr:XRE family transcriptional regulator [Streptomyces hygroscopicus]